MKFTIADLYKNNTLSQLESIFKVSEDIIQSLDEYALKELCEGYSWDVDKLFLDIIEESSNLLNTGGSIKSASFNYLTSLTDSLDDYLTDLSFAYFTSNKLPDFNIETYHLEWMNLIQIYRKLCILAARGHSKSFCFSFAYPLWQMWKYDGKSKIGKTGLLVTAEDSLVKHFMEMIASQVEENPLLSEKLFPGKTAVGWGKERLTTKNKFVLEGKSSNSNLRGRHDTAFIICDDFLDESNFFNPDVRKKTIEFFHSVIMNIPIYKQTTVGVVGCVKGDTLILEKEKGFINIVDLAPKGIDLYNKGLYDSNDKISSSCNDFKTSSKFFVNGRVPTKKILLDNGLSIEGSLIHPLWKLNEDGTQGWCKLPDLKVGDIIEIKDEEEMEDWGIPQKIVVPEFNNYSYKINLPEFINEEIAYFLGLWIAEGNFHKSTNQVQITNFEIDLSFMDKYGVHFESWDNGQRWYCSRKIFKEWMFTIFGRECKANQKHIPDCILRGPKSCLTACIQGMFDGDGTCGKLAYNSVSERLIDQLQSALLMGYGINSKKTCQTKEKTNKSNELAGRSVRANFNNYGLSFPEMEGLKFANRIGFKLERKQEKTLGYLNNCKDSISLPTPVTLLRKIKRLGTENKVKFTRISEQILKRDGYLVTYRFKDIYDYYSQYFNCIELDNLKKYMQKRWRKIESIIESEAYTYDFVIPEGNSFIGNGINNHNTPMSSDDLYANLKASKGWRVFEYPAIYPDGRLLSPERFDLQGLLEKKDSQGSIVFSREVLVKPISSESSLFPMNLLRMALVDTCPMVPNKYSIPFKIKKIGVGIDLSISASVGADYFLIVVIGLDEQNRYWVLNIVREKSIPYLQQVALVKQVNENFKPDAILCENNQYQEAFCQILRDNNIPVISKATGIDKYSFTVGMPAISVLFEQGRLKIPYQADPSTRTAAEMLITELYSMTFSSGKLQGAGAHDDIVSALWKGIQSLNYVSQDLMLSFLEVH